MNACVQAYRTATSFLCKIGWLPPLLVRVAIGYLFFEAGKGKLLNIHKPIDLMTNLGIPFPVFNAWLVSIVECVGGILIIIGLLTRLTAIPLAITMAVAIGTAQWGEVKSFSDLVWLSETAYLLIFLWLVTAGAGKASLDYWVSGKFRRG